MPTTEQVAEALRRMGEDGRRLTPEGKLRIARGIARKAVERGLWTQEEADEFVEGVKEEQELFEPKQRADEREEGKARDAQDH